MYEYVNVYEYDYATRQAGTANKPEQALRAPRLCPLPGLSLVLWKRDYLIRYAWSCMGSESISKDRVEPLVLKGISLPVTRSRIFMPGFAGRFITSFFPV